MLFQPPSRKAFAQVLKTVEQTLPPSSPMSRSTAYAIPTSPTCSRVVCRCMSSLPADGIARYPSGTIYAALGTKNAYISSRMGGRVVEGTGLENRQTRKRLEGSNPSPSASYRT
jgi:hypothetical protein